MFNVFYFWPQFDWLTDWFNGMDEKGIEKENLSQNISIPTETQKIAFYYTGSLPKFLLIRSVTHTHTYK